MVSGKEGAEKEDDGDQADSLETLVGILKLYFQASCPCPVRKLQVEVEYC